MDRKQTLIELRALGVPLKEIGAVLGGVSKQRVYQLLYKYNIETPIRYKHGYWRDAPMPHKWLRRVLGSKLRRNKWTTLFDHLKNTLPTHCPILGLELDYTFEGPRQDNRPSLDRINNELGYIVGNVQVISWRANRLKNDGTSHEHHLIANYLDSLPK